jgi:hypothetical protein
MIPSTRGNGSDHLSSYAQPRSLQLVYRLYSLYKSQSHQISALYII